MYEVRRIKRAAFWTVVGLIPISALIVMVNSDPSIGWEGLLIGTFGVTIFVSLVLALICMTGGFVTHWLDHDSEAGSYMVRFGAALGFVIFSGMGIFSLFHKGPGESSHRL